MARIYPSSWLVYILESTICKQCSTVDQKYDPGQLGNETKIYFKSKNTTNVPYNRGIVFHQGIENSERTNQNRGLLPKHE